MNVRWKQLRNINCPLRIPSKLVGRFGGKRMPIFVKVNGIRIQVGWGRDERKEDDCAN